MTSVKNMPRKQQQAVFASMGKTSDRSTVRGMQQKRDRLLRSNLKDDSHQDKVDRIMQNKRLTHRQKMDRIAKLKNKESRTTSSRPGTSTGVNSPGARAVLVKTLEKAEERRLARKAYRKSHPSAKFIPTSEPGTYILKENGRMYEWKGTGQKRLLKVSMSYSQLKKGGHKFMTADADKDGVSNSKDCRPLDKNKQDIEKVAAKAFKAFQKSRTPEARIKRAKAKIKAIKAREKAEKLEKEAKEKETAYKKAHPKKFGIF